MRTDFTLKKISDILQGALTGDGNKPVFYLSIDSRTISQTRNTLFIAIRGERHDGHRFLEGVYQLGIRMFLVSEKPEVKSFPGASFCVVRDTLQALQVLAGAKRDMFEGTVCGITGSNGKTIVKEWIFQCLRDSMKIVRSPKSYNSQVGVPLSAWMIDNSYDLSVLEAGISRPGEMKKLQAIISPDIGILTNIGAAHQENFLGLEEKLREKLILFKDCKKIIYREDASFEGVTPASFIKSFKGEKVGWSLDGDAKYRFRIESRGVTGTCVKLMQPESSGPLFTLPFRDDASVENAIHVIVFMVEMGFPVQFAAERISAVEPVSMRLELLKGIMGSVLINDAYNADLAGLASAIAMLVQQEPSRGKVVILSDILQSGKEQAHLYSEVAELVRLRRIDLFIGIGPDLVAHKGQFQANSHFFNDTGDFIQHFNKTLLRDKVILIKGSRKFRFEMITRELQQQVHQTSLQIDLNAMIHNLNYYRSLLKPGVRIMVVVKALSYGSGSSEIASLLQYHHVDYLGVAFVDEGVALREAGIYLPIMVFNPDPSSYETMMDYHLEPEVYNMKGLEVLSDLLDYRGEKNYPVHIKIDTGMHRLGFDPDEAGWLKQKLNTGILLVKSIFSHLSASEEAVHDRFTRKQIEMFERVSNEIISVLNYRPLRHLLNTSGMERFKEAQFDMVRLGIGLHGVTHEKELVPVSSFLTSISQIRKVKRGEGIGYSRKGTVDRDSVIAVIPVGYADGLDRRLSNGAGSVWVADRLVPIIGNICMDMTIIDVTGLKVQEGDPVEIFGKNHRVIQLAEQLDTIPYEILTSIPDRVKRIYIQE
ncbi:MAG: bifunctional UDP-N-acetylmuramoyl-tripeptide:D-alanyl-D-alanine ligase/alanine racemase [Bacteroidales bacterium]|nr:bifunctional UDP-N-acetylmuramoyl-tripeptide:D-alanyl-D-alanine ligase/alanine racemase [Bacteroidales bacterium]MBN2698993.1 bifunctional UDP-N-acetylmuramoyl-tripeptide:D-alanyl-D-alanine ligase/alanine racemase [Bacteroidales bacterium]